MAEYLPFQERHSIQEAQISILFLGPFEQRAIEEARGDAQAELSEDLPRVSEGHRTSVQIDMDMTALPSSTSTRLETRELGLMGFRLSKVQGNGQPARVLQLEDNALSVSFMDYDSWEATRKDALKYLRTVSVSLPLEQNPVVAFSLGFIDRYTYSGNPGEARADKLFVRDNPYIASHIFDAGAIWHCNTGWLDDATQGDRVLHNLNVTSSLVDLSSTITIEHQATRHLVAPRHTLATLFDPPAGATGLVEALESLHDRNKGILRQALRPEMLARIGMTK